MRYKFYGNSDAPSFEWLGDRQLREIEGKSIGADAEVDSFRARGLRVFQSLDEIPNLRSQTG